MKKKLYNSPLVEEMAIRAMGVIMESPAEPPVPIVGPGAPINRD